MALYLKIPKRILYLAPRHKMYYVTTTVLKAQLDWFFASLLLPLGLFFVFFTVNGLFNQATFSEMHLCAA